MAGGKYDLIFSAYEMLLFVFCRACEDSYDLFPTSTYCKAKEGCIDLLPWPIKNSQQENRRNVEHPLHLFIHTEDELEF